MKITRRAFLAPLLLLAACSGGSKKKEFWIYTSIYKDNLTLYKEPLERAFPEVEFRWFQGGSENVAAKVTAELASGETQADLLLSADMFFYEELAKQGKLLKIEGVEHALKVPAANISPDQSFIVNRYGLMVLAYNKDKIKEADRPKGFKDLVSPRFKGKLTMPSPLESGTALTAVLFLKNMLGDNYFKQLRQSDTLAAGGNGSAMARIQTGERPVGMLLIENVLQAKQKGQTNVEYVIPEEGALPMPSPAAVFKSTKDPKLALRVLDWFFSPEAQAIHVKAWMYSSNPDAPAPAESPKLSSIKILPWDYATFDRWGGERQGAKELFQQTVMK